MVPRLMAVYARMDLLWFLRDTRYCLLDIFSQTVSTLAAVSAVMLVSLRFGGIGGMTAGQVLFMMGYGTLAEGIVNLFFGGSNSGHISRIIGRGQLDHLLAVPAPIWVQLLTQGFIPVSGGNVFVCGIIMTAWSASRLHVAVTVPWLFLLALNLAASVAVIMSVVYIISCCAFFAPAAAEEISMPVHELFQTLKGYPLGGLGVHGILIFCTVIPVGLAAWFPANALLGKTPAALPPLLTVIAGLLLTVTAVLLFRKGMRYYAKYGSTRYSGFGYK